MGPPFVLFFHPHPNLFPSREKERFSAFSYPSPLWGEDVAKRRVRGLSYLSRQISQPAIQDT